MNIHQTDHEPPASPPPPLWLLDTTGQMLGHDTLNDRVIRQLFDTRIMPGLSLHLEAPLPQKNQDNPSVKAHFRKQVSLPFPLPGVDVIPIMPNIIALRCSEAMQHWVGIGPEMHEVHFDASLITENDVFLPLTAEALFGLAMMFDRELATIQTHDETTIGPAFFLPNRPHQLTLGDVTFHLAEHLDTLTQLGQLLPGQELSLSFGQMQDFTARRIG